MEAVIHKPLLGYEVYLVSETGNIWSENRKRYITPFIDSKGYLVFNISLKKGRRKRFFLHRAVAISFIPNPDNKATINHIDGNKLNNKIENLEWATIGDNVRHAWKNNLCRQAKAKYVLDTATGVKYDTLRAAANQVGIHFSKLSLMIRGMHKEKTTLIYVG